MAKRKRSPDLEQLTEEFMELVDRLKARYTLSHIAYNAGVAPTSFFKYAEGTLPESKPEKIRSMIAGMRKLDKSPKLELLEKPKSKRSKSDAFIKKLSLANDLGNHYKISSWLEDAVFEIVSDSSAEPEIQAGSFMAIKKIDIKDCEWGKYHYIIDTLNETYLRRIYKNEDGTYRLVAETDKYPDLQFEESKIEGIYRVILVIYKPK